MRNYLPFISPAQSEQDGQLPCTESPMENSPDDRALPVSASYRDRRASQLGLEPSSCPIHLITPKLADEEYDEDEVDGDTTRNRKMEDSELADADISVNPGDESASQLSLVGKTVDLVIHNAISLFKATMLHDQHYPLDSESFSFEAQAISMSSPGSPADPEPLSPLSSPCSSLQESLTAAALPTSSLLEQHNAYINQVIPDPAYVKPEPEIDPGGSLKASCNGYSRSQSPICAMDSYLPEDQADMTELPPIHVLITCKLTEVILRMETSPSRSFFSMHIYYYFFFAYVFHLHLA
ncbi:unnamed protein product [Protopolystoma xenopodis]|uniref:Uncharacterized protein n=1 Tax=Protopolystoma xenopodis TaxID=117903 RepID=A0A3S5ARF7_9PLAT|nr:unnamed protein product [Protopolystoma xenopodis]